MYAIVRCGGRQEKASVDDVLTVDKVAGDTGSTVTLPAVLVVDDGTVVSDPAELSRYTVTAEILGTVSGPKINMIHYRSKTGYKRRIGHRQRHTQLKITGIGPEGRGSSKAAAQATGDSGSTQKASGSAQAKPAGSSSGTRSRSRSTSAASGASSTRKADAGSGSRSSRAESPGRSGSARKQTAGEKASGQGETPSGKASAREATTGDKPGAAGESASSGQES